MATLKFVPVESVHPVNKNSLPVSYLELLAEHICDFAMPPILAKRSTGEIIEGESIWWAAKRIGWSEVFVLWVE